METYKNWETNEAQPVAGADKAALEDRLREAGPSLDKLETDQSLASDKQAPVQGFEKSGVMSNDAAAQYLCDRLPADHLSHNRISEIRYTDQFDGDQNGTVLGVCRTDTQTRVSQIEINRQTPQGSHDKGEMEQTMVHEVGHNAYYNMGDQNIVAWENLSSSSKPDEYVSNYTTNGHNLTFSSPGLPLTLLPCQVYARTNGREDFAESYAAYVRDPQLLQDVSPQKHSFMRQQLFGGREYVN
jgi:hypothetical protein